jgi:hypothetical protein
VPRGQRLRVGDVERGPQPPGGQLDKQRVGIDQRTAPRIDHDGAVAQPGQEIGVHDMAGRIADRQKGNDRVGIRQQGADISKCVHTRSRGPSDQSHFGVERLEPGGEVDGQITRPEHHDPLTDQGVGVARIPDAVGLGPRERTEFAVDGQ